jgi:hypothetical protein
VTFLVTVPHIAYLVATEIQRSQSAEIFDDAGTCRADSAAREIQ